MLLLTVRTWFGKGRNASSDFDMKPQVDCYGFATRLPLADAIKEFKRYQTEFNNYYEHTAIDYNIVSVSEIDELPDDVLDAGGIELIENLYDYHIQNR